MKHTKNPERDEQIKALLKQATALREELNRVEQELYDLDFEGYYYITGIFRRKSEDR